MTQKVCDFCLSPAKGFLHRLEKLEDGHYICKNCKHIVESYGLPLKYDLFQALVTAQPHMTDMIMDAYLENHQPSYAMEKFYPLPTIVLHEGEHCINAIKATLTVAEETIPEEYAVRSIREVRRNTIHNISDAEGKVGSHKVEGMLYETEAALYFMSSKIVNCHRLGYVLRNRPDTDKIKVITPTRKFTYTVEHADLFFYRERFFQKVNAALNNKQKHLIYITNDNEFRVTPGIYEIPKSLKPGTYRVKALKDSGLHIKDSLGRVTDYYDSEANIDLTSGGTLECTGEYQLQWIGEKKNENQ